MSALPQRLIAEHKKTMRRLTESLEEDKERQLSKLQQEIKKRREKRQVFIDGL